MNVNVLRLEERTKVVFFFFSVVDQPWPIAMHEGWLDGGDGLGGRAFLFYLSYSLPSSFFLGSGPYDPWCRIFPTLPFAGHALSVCLTGSDQILFFFFPFFVFMTLKKKKKERSKTRLVYCIKLCIGVHKTVFEDQKWRIWTWNLF